MIPIFFRLVWMLSRLFAVVCWFIRISLRSEHITSSPVVTSVKVTKQGRGCFQRPHRTREDSSLIETVHKITGRLRGHGSKNKRSFLRLNEVVQFFLTWAMKKNGLRAVIPAQPPCPRREPLERRVFIDALNTHQIEPPLPTDLLSYRDARIYWSGHWRASTKACAGEKDTVAP